MSVSTELFTEELEEKCEKPQTPALCIKLNRIKRVDNDSEFLGVL